ncbi:MAG: hypothetical protein QXF61_08700 [Nitrososphaeria archaeon]
MGDKRTIELYIRAVRGSVELKQFFVNGLSVLEWHCESRLILEGKTSKCILNYYWKMGKYYTVKVVAVDDSFAEVTVKSPVYLPSLDLKVNNVSLLFNPETLKIDVSYHVCSNGTDWTHLLLFSYKMFDERVLPIYIFYDQRYMREESIKRADAIVEYFRAFNLSIEKVDYQGLEWLCRSMPKSVLILVNPLRDFRGNRLQNAIPAPLIDPDGDGFIKEHSKYGKSFLYDWMKDGGLIFISVGSIQPYKRILYRDGGYCYTYDSHDLFDAHYFLTDAYGDKSIINGFFVLGNYTPVRVSCSMGLHYRESDFGFDKDAMENYGLQFYCYGDYKLYFMGGVLNLSMPVFFRVGMGGWLAMGDDNYWLSNYEFAHDLFMIFLQKVWDSEWVPYGWYWDNGCSFYSGYGSLQAEGTLETEFIPFGIVGNKLFLRVVCIAYCDDFEAGLLFCHIIEVQKGDGHWFWRSVS